MYAKTNIRGRSCHPPEKLHDSRNLLSDRSDSEKRAHSGILAQFYYIQIDFRKPEDNLQNAPRITRNNMHVHYVHPFYRSILLLEIQK